MYVSIRSKMGVVADNISVPKSTKGEIVLHNFIRLINLKEK